MPEYPPLDLQKLVEAKAAELGTAAYLLDNRNQRLREMWCAARFGIGYETHVGECTLEIESEDERREYDFHLRALGSRLPFQIAEVLDSGRRRGDEYRGRTRKQVTEALDRRPSQGDWYAAKRVREALASKNQKYRTGSAGLHMLLYVNIKASSVPWASVANATEHEAKAFASVWLLTQDLFCCIHSGKVWSGFVGWKALDRAHGG
jgi:hypothetical protein